MAEVAFRDTHEPQEPQFPILDWRELGEEIRDLRDELPEHLAHIPSQLSPDDAVIYFVTPEIKRPTRPPVASREILRLCRADHPSNIGKNGAPLAGLSSLDNLDVAALRKFEVAHGRDALEMSLKVSHLYPELLRATVLELAQTQGLEQEPYIPGSPFGHEEPGRIILLSRDPDDPMTKKFQDRLNWKPRFYGSIDATPTFVSAIANYCKEHGDTFLNQTYQAYDGQEYTVNEALDRSLGWILQRLSENPDGLLEFHNPDEAGKGMAAQAWKDSPFAYVHADGSRANYNDGIASVEVQGFAYDALLDAADLYSATRPEKAAILYDQAATLRQKIFDTYWIDHPEKGGFFALATDRDENGQLRTLNVRSSNMGRLLNTRLFDSDDPFVRHMCNETIRQLCTPEMLAAAGIRTLASDEVAFRAGSYHTGSVWRHDSDACADGIERQGFPHAAWEVRARGWRTDQKTGKFVEFARGDTDNTIRTNPSEVYVYNRRHGVLHLFEQPPQEVQGWCVTASLANKRAYPDYLRHRSSIPISEFERWLLSQIPTHLPQAT